MTQLAGFDPTPMQVTVETAPRVCAWVNTMDDLSGLDAEASGWFERDQLLEGLKPLLTEIGGSYVPVMLANAAALAAGEQNLHTTVDGKTWKQPAFPYHGRCLQWIRERYLALTDSDRQWVDALFLGTGCEALMAGV